MDSGKRQFLRRITTLAIGIPALVSLSGCFPLHRGRGRGRARASVAFPFPHLRWSIRYRRLIIPAAELVVGSQVVLPDGRPGSIMHIGDSRVIINVENSTLEYEYEAV